MAYRELKPRVSSELRATSGCTGPTYDSVQSRNTTSEYTLRMAKCTQYAGSVLGQRIERTFELQKMNYGNVVAI